MRDPFVGFPGQGFREIVKVRVCAAVKGAWRGENSQAKVRPILDSGSSGIC